MKKILYSAATIALLFSAGSCREDFLESAPTETLGNPPVTAKLNGLYLMMVKTETGGTTNHDDFGQKGYDIYSDMLSGDMVLGATTYGWYSTVANLTAPVDFTNTVNYKPWRYYYRLISAANDVINDLGGNAAQPVSASDKASMGQAKAMRAYAYFYLMQLYTRKFEASSPSIPLYLVNSPIPNGKSTQQEVYTQIVDDLTQARTLLQGYSRPNKGAINADVATGLLAYTYAAMERYQDAAVTAESLIGKYPVTTNAETAYDIATSSGGGFNNLNTASWMWGFDIDIVNDLDLVSWWGQTDIFTYSYAWAGDPKAIDLGLYAQINADDVRKKQFVTVSEGANGIEYADATEDGDYPAVPANKFFSPQREIGGQRNITTDYLFMRVDEFHLLAAENYAKAGNEAKAKTILKNFLQNRLSSTAYIDALSGNALKNEIYLQTRIELWGEGKSYLAMKRNRATIKRGPNHLFFAGQSFSYDDDRLSLDIPQAEINNNPKLK